MSRITSTSPARTLTIKRRGVCCAFGAVCLSGGPDPHWSHLGDRSYQNREDACGPGVQSPGGQCPRSAPQLSRPRKFRMQSLLSESIKEYEYIM